MFTWISKILDGYKTKIAMVSAVAAFVLFVSNTLLDGFQPSDLDGIVAAFSAMTAVLGIGHKAAKIEDALKK